MELRAWVYTAEQLSGALDCPEVTAVYVPMKLAGDVPDKQRSKVILLPPEYLADCEERVERELNILREKGFERALAHTSGHIELLTRRGFTVCGGNRLNVTNSMTMRFFAEQGLSDIIVSPELTVQRINSLDKPVPTGFLAYGYLPLMLCRRCPVHDGKPCGRENCGERLTDRMGNKMSVICSENTVEILNSNVLMLGGRLGEFRTDFAVLRFTVEKDVKSVVKLYSENREEKSPKLTRGLYYRGVE
ncbi:MAG: U32 family peptidase [Ruminiclostridium sp.]|nr:U32 family peptidase [Ruminiclostridium sp.]